MIKPRRKGLVPIASNVIQFTILLVARTNILINYNRFLLNTIQYPSSNITVSIVNPRVKQNT